MVSNDFDIEEELIPYNESFLLGQLKRIEDSSQESVEGDSKLSNFKSYLHVNRSIEDELNIKLVDAINKNGSKLVILCGSSGDGKSHLISYFKHDEESPLNKFNFKVIPDATESDSPMETNIDTLVKNLKNFNDENIEKSNEKVILLANLGVLNNFMNSTIVKEKFNTLLKSLNSLSIFDAEDYRNVLDSDYVSVVSFSDYYLFEFDEDNPYNLKSNYLTELFSRITKCSPKNYFYQAYLKDKNRGMDNILIRNYELFCEKDVQDTIINLIIKSIIKHKLIISTREILNFIFEIIVPSTIDDYEWDKIKPINSLKYLLPNLLFNSKYTSDLLRIINYEDPVFKRNKITDELLKDLATNWDLDPIFDEYMISTNIFKDIFDFNIYPKQLELEDKQILLSLMIRMSNLFGKPEVKKVFTNNSYLKYVNYLYYYNKIDSKGNANTELINLTDEIKESIFNWYGKLKEDVLCINVMEKFRIGERIDITFEDFQKFSFNDKTNRFKTSIQLYFSSDGHTPIKLNLDYSLYDMISKINNGYTPNSTDKKDLILFNEFINQLIVSNKDEDYLIYHQEGIYFKLKYNRVFDRFNFSKV